MQSIHPYQPDKLKGAHLFILANSLFAASGTSLTSTATMYSWQTGQTGGLLIKKLNIAITPFLGMWPT